MQKLFVLLSVCLAVSCTTPPRTESSQPQKSVSSSVSVISTGRSNSVDQLNKPYVLVISIDGYRHDYNQKYAPPNLSKFEKEGASAKSLVPVFPSKTFPNHYSIVTGLYPENHGIVGNSFYDFTRAKDDQTYRLSLRKAVSDGTWYRGWPIWSVAEKNGMLSGVFFWPGSEAKIQGQYPAYYLVYDEKIANHKRVEQVVEWFKLPAEKRPHFAMLYFSDVDSAGHTYGPDSKEVKEAVHKVDAELGVLFEQLKALPHKVNVVIVSDHGMAQMDANKAIYLDDLTDMKGVLVGEMGPQALIYRNEASPEQMEKIYQDLKKKEKNYKVYWRTKLPKHLHYSKDPRAGDILVLAEAPYSVGTHEKRFTIPMGNHGYDPARVKDMHGVFFAQGPNVKNVKVGELPNVNIYPWILKTLKLKAPAPVDGKVGALEAVYK